VLGTVKALAILVVAAALVYWVHDWIAARRAAAQLQTTLATEKKLIDAASQRETKRNSDLQTALAQIETLKKQSKTPQQAASALQEYLQLPVPIEAIPPDAPPKVDPSAGREGVATSTASLPEKPQAKSVLSGVTQNVARLPSADIAPLYNYVQDCRECDLKLAAANANLADAKSQLTAVARERDAALAANRRGLLPRLREDSVCILIGLGSGAALGRRAHLP
jgi:hypothetical protein